MHFDGAVWTKTDFGNSWMFSAICGSSSSGIAYACAVNSSTQESVIIRLTSDKTEVIYRGGTFGDPVSMNDIVLRTEDELWTAGTSIRRFTISTGQLQTLLRQPTSGYSMNVISCAAPNDIYFWGDDFAGQLLTHFNGSRFTSFALPQRGYVMQKGGHATSQKAIMTSLSDNKAYIVTAARR